MSSANVVRRPGAKGPPLRLETFLPYRLAVLAHTVSKAIAARYEADFGLSIPEWRVMALLGAEPGLTATQVAEATPMDKVAVSRAVRALTAAGRLTAVADGADGRRQRLALTAQGLDVYRRIVPLARALEAQLVCDLSAGEQDQLWRLIDRLETAADRLERPTPA